MNTKIYLDFSKNTKLGAFVREHEILDEDAFCYGLMNVSYMKIIPRIGETMHIEYEGYGYQKKLLDVLEKRYSGAIISDLFRNSFEGQYIVKDIVHCFGSDDFGDIHFINILLEDKSK